jgi:hypothetical protein
MFIMYYVNCYGPSAAPENRYSLSLDLTALRANVDL